MLSPLQCIPSELLSGLSVCLWSTNLDFRITGIVGGEDLKNRLLASPTVVTGDRNHSFDIRYVQHPDVKSLIRARAGERVEWETQWGGRVKACVTPVLGSASKPTGVVGAAVDMSQLDASERRRVSMEGVLFTLLEKGDFSAAILSQDKCVLFANQAFMRAFNVREGEILESDSCSPVLQESMRVPSFVSPREYLTVHIEAPRELEESAGRNFLLEATRYMNLLNGFPRPVAILGTEGLVESANTQFSIITGITNGQLERKHISTNFTELTGDALDEIWRTLMESEHRPSVVDRELNFVDSSQKTHRAHVTFSEASTLNSLIMMTVNEWNELRSWADARQLAARFSHADRRILELLAAGATNAQIAATLYLSRQGLDYRLKSLRARLHAESRGALVGRAFTEGLFVGGAWPPRMIDGQSTAS